MPEITLGAISRIFTLAVHFRASEAILPIHSIALEEDLHGCNAVRFDDFPVEELGVAL